MRLDIIVAKAGVELLSRSKVFQGYFEPWRWGIFEYAQAKGLHVLPVHYYSPIPNAKSLQLDDATPRFDGMSDPEKNAALAEIEAMVAPYAKKLEEIRARVPYRDEDPTTDFRFGRAPYSPGEAEVLYSLIRSRRPLTIIEIGCGHTTFLMAEAIRDEGYSPRYLCIEPYRPDYLSDLPEEVSEFMDSQLQDVPLDLFSNLEAGDILFIDSSHVVAYGSDTVHEILRILPILKPGVLVHFHDIFLPYDYPTQWLNESRFFWNEQYMLAAYLSGHSGAKTWLPLHQLYRERPEQMERLFPGIGQSDHGPGALWITP